MFANSSLHTHNIMHCTATEQILTEQNDDSDKPRLPSSGFDYDATSLTRMLSLPMPKLFEEQPGCGRLPLRVRGNRAGRYGGGVFQRGCDMGLDEKGICFIGGTSAEASDAFILSFEDNSAEASGGSAHTTCWTLGVCEKVLKSLVALPNPGGDARKILFFHANTAAGYGSDVASAPSAITVSGEPATAYVPGQTSLDVTFSMLDSMGQV